MLAPHIDLGLDSFLLAYDMFDIKYGWNCYIIHEICHNDTVLHGSIQRTCPTFLQDVCYRRPRGSFPAELAGRYTGHL